MKKMITLLTILCFASFTLSTTALADVKKGHKIYKKRLHKSCQFPGSIFARKHTQDEWEELKENGKFKETVKTICPAFELSRLNEKQWDDLYDFTYQFGIGGEIPNGCDPK